MSSPSSASPTSSSSAVNDRAAYALRTIFEGRKHGALICETDDAKRLVFFEAGHLVGAKSDRVYERLGEILVREGAITRDDLDRATRYIRSGRKLGRILVELGVLRGGEIEDYVRLQIREIACAILVSTPTRLVFSDRLPVEALTLAPVSVADVFLACFRSLSLEGIPGEHLASETVVDQTDNALALAQWMKLSDEEAFVIDLVDGSLTVQEIVDRAPLAPEEAKILLLAFLHSGAIVSSRKDSWRELRLPAPEPPAESTEGFERTLVRVYNEMQCQNHWQVLGLAHGASYQEVEKAYQEKQSMFAVAPGQASDADFLEKLSFVQSRLREAFVTLASKTSSMAYGSLDEKEGQYQATKEKFEAISPEDSSPPEPVRPRDVEEARRLFSRARSAYQARDYWKAIELCRASIELDDTNDPERFHLLGKALSENPRWRRDAEKNLNIAHQLKPWEPRYLDALGKLYEKEGMHQRAQRIFEQVRAMDPDFDTGAG